RLPTQHYMGEVTIHPLHLRGTDVDVRLPISLEKDKITLSGARISTPESEVKLSGTMEHLVAPRTTLQFDAQIALDEARRLAALAMPMNGAIHVSGNGTLDQNNSYKLTANAEARNVSITSGTTKLSAINLDSSISADPHVIHVGGLRLTAPQGSVTG